MDDDTQIYFPHGYERPDRHIGWRNFSIDPISAGTIIPPWQQWMVDRFGWVAEGHARGTFFKIHHGRDGKFRFYYRTRSGAYRLSVTYTSMQDMKRGYWWDTIERAHIRGQLWMIDRM